MFLERSPKLRKLSFEKLDFWYVYPLSVLFIFHTLLVAYINSSYMEQYLSPEGVGALFTIGSALAVFAFLFFTPMLRAWGNVRLTLVLATIDILSLIVLGATDVPATAIVSFVVFLTINPLLLLNIDIFSESLIGQDESSTGTKRGIVLMLISIASVLAPLTMGVIVDGRENLSIVYYYAGGVFVVFIVFLLVVFRKFKDPVYTSIRVRTTLGKLWRQRDIKHVLIAHFILQIFFTWMIIYVPLYLSTEIGLPWDAIGIIIAVGLFAYVLLELPIGWIADTYIGEKELMAIGFVILSVSSSWIAFMNEATIYAWMALLFTTRIGASLAEATTESYFFKHTKGGDADTIGVFRLLRPLASVVGALLGSAALLYLPFNLMFVVLGLIMVPGIFVTMALTDTK